MTHHTHRSSAAPAGAVLAGLALVLAACGDGEPTTSVSEPSEATTSAPASTDPGATTSEVVVEIERSRFIPLELEVDAGATVVFRNLDPYAHTVTSSDGSPIDYDSGSFGEDETFEQAFEEPGSYDYFCEIHPTMRATVVVG